MPAVALSGSGSVVFFFCSQSLLVCHHASLHSFACSCCRAVRVMVEVSLAMVEKDGQWLLQLRDDLEWIVAPGCWGLFGGHLEPGETPEDALRRELLEEISWRAGAVRYRFQHSNSQRVLHFFHASLQAPLDSLCLREGQDVVLASMDDLRTGSIWSPAVRQFRPLAPSLQLAVAHWSDGA